MITPFAWVAQSHVSLWALKFELRRFPIRQESFSHSPRTWCPILIFEKKLLLLLLFLSFLYEMDWSKCPFTCKKFTKSKQRAKGLSKDVVVRFMLWLKITKTQGTNSQGSYNWCLLQTHITLQFNSRQ